MSLLGNPLQGFVDIYELWQESKKKKFQKLQDPYSKEFDKAYRKAWREWKDTGKEIPKSLRETLSLRGQAELERATKKAQIIKEQEAMEQVMSKWDSQTVVDTKTQEQPQQEPVKQERESSTPPPPPPGKNNDGIVVQRKIAVKPQKPKSLNSELFAKLKRMLGVNKLEYSDIGIALGCRSTFFKIKLKDIAISRANNKKIREDIAISLNAGEKSKSVVSIQTGGILLVTVTEDGFSPLYVEVFLHLLKKEGDFLIGEVKGKVRVENIFNMPQAHIGVAGGSNSGKSYFLNAMAQSLNHSTPSGRFWYISPKGDAKGGDFSRFASYKNTEECLVIATDVDALRRLLEQTLTIIKMLRQLINERSDMSPKFLFIDELAYFLEIEEAHKKPSEDSDEDEVREYEVFRLRKKVLAGIKDISQRGRSVNIRMILGTQLFTKEVFNNQIMANITQISFKASLGDGGRSGFNKLSEQLLTKGDGLYFDPKTNEPTNFQALLATP